ncbi:MAG TPA: hypothetical protein VG389_29410 [Myxococcota bacterium]|nr:hypothetical protein [Myxococcota bacterium]
MGRLLIPALAGAALVLHAGGVRPAHGSEAAHTSKPAAAATPAPASPLAPAPAPAPASAPTPAASRPAPLILVAGVAEDDPLVARLRAEVGALGLGEPRVVTGPDAADFARLGALAGTAGAVAAIRVVPPGGTLEVWLVDPSRGTLALRETVTALRADDADATLALRAVEVLRAALLAPPPPPPRLVAESTPVSAPATPPAAGSADVGAGGGAAPVSVAARVAPRPERIAFETGAGTLFSVAASPPAPFLLARVGVRLMITPRWGVRVTGGLTPVIWWHRGDFFRTGFAAATFGAALRVLLARPGAGWQPTLDASLSALYFETINIGYGPPFEPSGRDHLWSVVSGARIGLGRRLGRWLMLRAEAGLGLGLPAARVNLLDSTVTWGPLFADASLGLEVTL